MSVRTALFYALNSIKGFKDSPRIFVIIPYRSKSYCFDIFHNITTDNSSCGIANNFPLAISVKCLNRPEDKTDIVIIKNSHSLIFFLGGGDLSDSKPPARLVK